MRAVRTLATLLHRAMAWPPEQWRAPRHCPAGLGLVAYAGILVVGLLAGCTGGQPVPARTDAPGTSEIAVIGRDMHTEIGLAVQQISGPLATLRPVPDGSAYLIVGFGDRDYFTDHDAGFGTALAALFPGPSAIQLATFNTLPDDAAHTIVHLRLSQDAIDRIVAFVWNSIDKASDGTPVIAAQHNPRSLFYAGRQSYDSFYNCNTWTAEALRAGGLAFDPSGVIFASDVLTQARLIAEAQAGAAKPTK